MSSHTRSIVAMLATAIAIGFSTQPLAGQTPTPEVTTRGAATWPQPRTPWGDPDIQGVWNNKTWTPFERPRRFGDRKFLTDEEFAQRIEQIKRGEVAPSVHLDSVSRQYDTAPAGRDSVGRRLEATPAASAGNPAPADSPPSTATAESPCGLAGCGGDPGRLNRLTSLVIDPPDGRVPPLTPEGEKRARARKLGPGTDITDAIIDAGYEMAGPEDLGTWVRCITRSLPNSMIPGAYGSFYEIVQAPGYVVVNVEMVHETRTIPLDGRPHLAPRIRQWMGDPRGHWEGNTLVVETTNFSDKTTLRGSGPNMRLIERFTRLGPDTMDYQFTIDDPQMFTKPWTVALPMTTEGSPDRLSEYACHEGNYALVNILSAARAKEKAAKKP